MKFSTVASRRAEAAKALDTEKVAAKAEAQLDAKADANKSDSRVIKEQILVIVNSHIITRKGFQQAFEQQNAALYRQFSGKELDDKLKEARNKTLQGLVDAHLIEDKAADLDIKIPDDYVRQYVEQIKKENNFATDADFERALRGSAGIGFDDFIKQQKRQIVQQELLRGEVYRKIAIEDNEIRAYYEDHKEEYRLPARFHIRELVIAKGATEAEKTAAQAKVAEVQAALKAGKNFDELVKDYSTSPSKSTGGDLGWMNRGLLRASIEDAALALKPNEVSQPIETDKDIYLVQLLASEGNPIQPFAEVKPKILEKLQEPKAQNAIEQYLSNLRTRANIRYLVPKADILKG
jgi:peptidyl-prolyl cis-trans isomerase SurA